MHHSVISPFHGKEELLCGSLQCVEFDLSHPSDVAFLSQGDQLAREKEHLYYGYPICLYHDHSEWKITPLFMQEVAVTMTKGTHGTVRIAESEGLEVNLHLFQRQHAQIEELKAIIRDLEGDFPTFDDRLISAFQALGYDNAAFSQKALDPWPSAPLKDGTWYNRPIIFKSERSPYTIHLRKELEILSRDTSIQAKLGSTALGLFLNPAKPVSSQGQTRTQLIKALPMNRSQEAAANSALTEPLTVVTGPPGTGKSQVVVNLLASCALAGKPVLFASKNNKAVDVVRQRLRELLGGQQDWVLRLGNRQVMEECRQEMDGKLAAAGQIPEETPISPHAAHQIDAEVESTQKNIEEASKLTRDLSACDFENKCLERKVPTEWRNARDGWTGNSHWLMEATEAALWSKKLSSPGAETFRIRLQRTIFKKRTLKRLSGAMKSIGQSLPEGIQKDLSQLATGDFRFLADTFGLLCAFGNWHLSCTHYEEKVSLLNRLPPAASLISQLEDLQVQRAAITSQQLRIAWTNRIKKSPTHYRLSRYFDLVNRAANAATPTLLSEWASQISITGTDLPVWIVTSLAARRALPLTPGMFDLVIIDEASQCDIPSAIPLLYRARKALIIGDPHQLQHISTLRAADENDLADTFHLENEISTWSYNSRSLYNLAEEVNTLAGRRIGFLAEHYRSHPDIVEYSNKAFYQGRLVLRTRVKALKDRLAGEPLGVIWHDTPGNVPSSSHSAYNDIEAKAVLSLLEKWYASGFLKRKDLSFGIVTPFRLQVEKCKELLSRAP